MVRDMRDRMVLSSSREDSEDDSGENSDEGEDLESE